MRIPRFEELPAITGGRWLESPPSGEMQGVAIDSREAVAGGLHVAIRGQRFDGHDFLAEAGRNGAAAAMVERTAGVCESGAGAADDEPAPGRGGTGAARADALRTRRTPPRLLVPSTRAALAALGREWRRRFEGAATAITGSCGKTTTRRLLASILDRLAPTVQSPRSFNNDLGVPLTVVALRPRHSFLVAEVGMNRPGEIRPLSQLVEPSVAVITSIGPVHLEALGSVEAIAEEKASILDGLTAGGHIVFPAESGLAQHAVGGAIARRERELGVHGSLGRLTFGLTSGDVRLHSRRGLREGSVLEIDGPWGRLECILRLPGEHNAMNALAAAAAAHLLGAPPEAIAEGLAGVEPSEMRFVREVIGEVVVVNDAYNANPVAMRASVRAFMEQEASALRRVTVLGDMLELGGASERFHRELGAWLAADPSAAPDLAVFVGSQSAWAAEEYRRSRPGSPVLVLPDNGPPSATALLEALRPGDAVLFKASRGGALEQLISALRDSMGGVAVGADGSPRP